MERDIAAAAVDDVVVDDASGFESEAVGGLPPCCSDEL